MDEDSITKLERLAALFKEGMLTEEEFNQKKRDILDGAANSDIDASVTKSDFDRPSDVESTNHASNQTDASTTVLSVIDAEYLTPTFGSSSAYYSQKFNKIVSKAEIGDLDISGNLKSINTKVRRTTTFNLWGLLFGPLWGCYRRLPSAWLTIFLIAIYGAGEIALDFSYPTVDRGIAISGAVLFGFLGNSLLLSRYLDEYSRLSALEDISRKLSPAYWAPVAAIAIILAPPFMDEMMTIMGTEEVASLLIDEETTTVSDDSMTDNVSEWEYAEGNDPITQDGITAVSRIFVDDYRIRIEISCMNGSSLNYQFSAFDTDDVGVPFIVSFIGGSGVKPFEVRTSDGKVGRGYADTGKYLNVLEVGRRYFFGGAVRLIDLASADRLIWRLELQTGEQIIEVDQTDPMVAKVVEPCASQIGENKANHDAKPASEYQPFKALDRRNPESITDSTPKEGVGVIEDNSEEIASDNDPDLSSQR